MSKKVIFKDAQGNSLYPRCAVTNSIPEGAFLAISVCDSAITVSSTTATTITTGTWHQYGLMAREGKSIMKITVPRGEKWSILFRTNATRFSLTSVSGSTKWAGVGTVRLSGDGTGEQEWYDFGMAYETSGGNDNLGAYTETVVELTAGTYYFGVYAVKNNTSGNPVAQGGATHERPVTNTSYWANGHSIIQIAQLVNKESV